jgi:hypothetical protein
LQAMSRLRIFSLTSDSPEWWLRADAVWRAFMRGEYDIVVLHAMKPVEVAVPNATPLAAVVAARGVVGQQNLDSAGRVAPAQLWRGANQGWPTKASSPRS